MMMMVMEYAQPSLGWGGEMYVYCIYAYMYGDIISVTLQEKKIPLFNNIHIWWAVCDEKYCPQVPSRIVL